MALSCGIVGLPNVGKSTIFNALTRSAQAATANYAFATVEPNVGEVPIPDDRLKVLAEIVRSRRIVHATTRFVDIAGLAPGASTGAGLGNAFLHHIRESDAIAMVLHAYDNGYAEGPVDPLHEAEIVNVEMALADLGTLERRTEKLDREVRANPRLASRLEAAGHLKTALEDGKPARSFPPESGAGTLARESFLLTVKPLLYVVNVDEARIGKPDAATQAVFDLAAREGSRALAICGKVEAELAGLSEAEARAFSAELGIDRSALDQLILAAYDLLGLMTFLTAGEKEVRAWTIARGTKAPQAAGKIHSDIERGFIRAEIVSYDDYARLRSMEALRAAGLVRLEGKDYVMQEGDVVNFRFNV